MLRARLVGLVLSVAAFLAVAVPLAHAGGAAGQALPPGTTACRAILNGENVKYVLNLSDNLGSQDVGVATPVLLCDMPPPSPDEQQVAAIVVKGPTLTTIALPTQQIICYQVSGTNQQDKTPATITDAFGIQTVQVSGFRLLCLPAQVE